MRRPAAVAIAVAILFGLAAIALVTASMVVGLVEPPAELAPAIDGLTSPARELAVVGLGLAAVGYVIAAVGIWQIQRPALYLALGLLSVEILASVAVAAGSPGEVVVGAVLAIGVLAGAALVGLLTGPVREAFGL